MEVDWEHQWRGERQNNCDKGGPWDLILGQNLRWEHMAAGEKIYARGDKNIIIRIEAHQGVGIFFVPSFIIEWIYDYKHSIIKPHGHLRLCLILFFFLLFFFFIFLWHCDVAIGNIFTALLSLFLLSCSWWLILGDLQRVQCVVFLNRHQVGNLICQ